MLPRGGVGSSSLCRCLHSKRNTTVEKVVGGFDTMASEMGPTIGVLFALAGGIAISMRRQKSKLADNDHVAV